jgi:hypothetical protein
MVKPKVLEKTPWAQRPTTEEGGLRKLGHKDIEMTMKYPHLSKEVSKGETLTITGPTTGKNKKATFEAVASPLRGRCHKTATNSTLATAPPS